MITASHSDSITEETTTRRPWQGLLLGLCAVMLLVSDGYQSGLTLQALILPFVAVMSISFGTLFHKRLELQNKLHHSDNVPVSLLLLIHSAGALALLLPLSASRDQLHLNFTLSQWMIVLWLALVVSLGAYGLMLILLRNMPTMQVASLSYLVPPATLMQAYWVFGNRLSLLDVISLCIAALGVYLVMKPIVDRPGMPHSRQSIGG